MLISNNSPVGNIISILTLLLNENARILRCLQMDYFEAGVARSQMFTSDVIKAQNVHVEL